MSVLMPVFMDRVPDGTILPPDRVMCFARNGTAVGMQYSPDAYAVLAFLLRRRGALAECYFTIDGLCRSMGYSLPSRSSAKRTERVRQALAELTAHSDPATLSVTLADFCNQVNLADVSGHEELCLLISSHPSDGSIPFALVPVDDIWAIANGWNAGAAIKLYAYVAQSVRRCDFKGKRFVTTAVTIGAHTNLHRQTVAKALLFWVQAGALRATTFRSKAGKSRTIIAVADAGATSTGGDYHQVNRYRTHSKRNV